MLTALIGGLLIGLSASLAWSGARRVAGISGLLGRFVREPFTDGFGVWFLAGLLLTSVVVGRVYGASLLTQVGPRSVTWLVLSGLLVGFGTQLARGCTSGHGVCGLARLSGRSLVATLTFMGTAGVVVYLTHHTLLGALR